MVFVNRILRNHRVPAERPSNGRKYSIEGFRQLRRTYWKWYNIVALTISNYDSGVYKIDELYNMCINIYKSYYQHGLVFEK